MQRGWIARRCGGISAGVLLVVGLIGSGGCKNVQEGWPDAASGMLGYAEFCEDDVDGFDDGFDDDVFGEEDCTPLPSTFAVGSRFRARAKLSDELPEEIENERVEPASTEYVDRIGTELTVLEAGRVALLARGRSEIIDYVMIGLYDVDAIDIDLPATPPLDEAFELSAIPRSGGLTLAGELDYVWTATSDGIEILTEFDRTGRASLLVTTVEDVTFEVSAGGHTEQFTLNAYPGPSRLRPGVGTGTGGSDTGSDSGSDSGSDTDGGTDSGTDSGSDTGSDSSTGGGQ